jgi:hypothetical protein
MSEKNIRKKTFKTEEFGKKYQNSEFFRVIQKIGQTFFRLAINE